MGMSAGGSKDGAKSEMNVTPLVDVVLVLLVIFMVTMPVMMRNITIEIPRDLEADEVQLETTQVAVLGKANGELEISDGVNKVTVSRGELAGELKERLKAMDPGKRTVFVDFEDGVPWEQAVSVMDTVKGVGKERKDGDQQSAKVALKKRKEDEGQPAGATP